MGGNEISFPTGSPAVIIQSYETRHVTVAEGIEFHNSDKKVWNDQNARWADVLDSNPGPERIKELSDEIHGHRGVRLPPNPSQKQKRKIIKNLRAAKDVLFHDYLQEHMGEDYTVISDDRSEYTSELQKVHFTIQVVTGKSDYKSALETEGMHVIYSGHSRYGRGACFGLYDGVVERHGEHWGSGTGNNDGMFRLAYPFVPVQLHDLEKHQYLCHPVRIEDDTPPKSQRHPDARRRLRRVSLTPELQKYVAQYHKSPSNQYYGVKIQGKQYILLHAGWEDTRSEPFDLGNTELRCRVFCHFGCSSRLHYWRIVRRPEYKAWQRPVPPSDKYAYFTTKPAYGSTAIYWLRHWFSYNRQNSFQPWWESLEYTKRALNRQLKAGRNKYRIY